MTEITIQESDLVILAIVVLWLGDQFTRRISILRRYSIPLAVSGGLFFSILTAVSQKLGGPKVTFDLAMRDTLLLVFFTTIGISAKLSKLKSGGRALLILVICAAFFLLLQDLTGVLLAKLVGEHPAYGLFAGSISLAGGHGTAIAWGQEATAAGFTNAELVGIAFATFGLIAGGIIGGPTAEYLIKKHKLSPQDDSSMKTHDETQATPAVSLHRILVVLFVIAICLSCGEIINRFLFENAIQLPGFLTAMFVGICITNLADRWKIDLNESYFDWVGEVSLQLFLAMSLMSMDLLSIAGAFGVIFFVLTVQIVVISGFSAFFIFKVMGKDYDAAVIAGGFCGLGMGATPVAIANMDSITTKHGPSFKAFLVIPLVGAFFVDIMNAIVIKFFIGMSFMQP